MASRPSLLPNTNNVSLSLSAKTPFSSSMDPPYVIDVLSFSSSYAAAGSDSRIVFYDKSSLRSVREVPASSSGSVKSISQTNGNEEALVATYENGQVGVFDLRSPENTAQIRLKGPNNAPCLCAAVNLHNTYLASGTELFQHEATVRIHDLRSPGKPLHVYNEAHSDDVSTLSFHPTSSHLLLSGAMDGLSSTVDVRIADEDDAILHTANVGASLSKVGWVNLPSGKEAWQGTFALTNMETLSLFDAADEMSVVKEYGDLREIECPTWQTHYVIDCQGTENGLALFAGQREGGLAIMQAPFEGDWSLEQVLNGGHTDIVRGCKVDLSQGTVVSCGEDGQVCLWSAPEQVPQAEAASDLTSPASTPLKAATGRETKTARYAPY